MPDPHPLKDKAPAYEHLVEHWFFESFHGSLIARFSEVWNAVHAAKEDLKRRLAAFLAETDAPPKG